MSRPPSPRGDLARRARVLVATLLGALVFAACASGGASRIVDGWLIETPTRCTDLGIPEDRCAPILGAARAHADATGGPGATWTIHDAVPVDAAGSPRLHDSGGGMPVGILVVRSADGSEAATPIGCFQPISPRQPPDCP